MPALRDLDPGERKGLSQQREKRREAVRSCQQCMCYICSNLAERSVGEESEKAREDERDCASELERERENNIYT